GEHVLAIGRHGEGIEFARNLGDAGHGGDLSAQRLGQAAGHDVGALRGDTTRVAPCSSKPRATLSVMPRPSASSATAVPTASAMPRKVRSVRAGRRARLENANPNNVMPPPPRAA